VNSDVLSASNKLIVLFAVLLYLHRAFFARALIQNPDDPFKSEYSYSVHAVLRNARVIIYWLNAAVRRAPALCARMHYMWSIGLTAAVRKAK
jgi:hypothetical protein